MERNKTKTEYLILKTILEGKELFKDDEGRITAANISKELKISYNHTFSILKDFEDKKLIEKNPNGDKRIWKLSLTKEGQDKLKAYRVIFE